jgi:hypothetical protein
MTVLANQANTERKAFVLGQQEQLKNLLAEAQNLSEE